jgi:hypothetical protein
MIQAPNPAHMLFNPCSNIFSTCPSGSRPFYKMATKLQVDCLWQAKFAIHIICMCKLHLCCVKYVIQLHLFPYFSIIWLKPISITEQNMKKVITVFTVFRLLTDFVCLYTYEFWLSLWKIVRSSVILLLPLFMLHYQGTLEWITAEYLGKGFCISICSKCS